MLRYIVKRLLWMIPTILGILLIIFTINDLMPGDPALNSLGANYTEELYQQRREEMGLNRPFVVRYVEYVVDLATRLDFGESYSTLRPVKNMIAERLGVTLLLGIYGSLITIVLGVIIGILSAVRQYSILDYVTTILATFFAAMPNFWLALMGVIIFSQNLQLLPASGLSTWKHWIMPVICIGIGPIALVVRMTRTSMLDVVRQDYIRTARAKGVKERAVIYKHALRNDHRDRDAIVSHFWRIHYRGNDLLDSRYGDALAGRHQLPGLPGDLGLCLSAVSGGMRDQSVS